MASSIFKLVLIFLFVVAAFEESDFEDLNWDSHNLWNQACEIVVNKVYANMEKNSNGMHVKVGSKNTKKIDYSQSEVRIYDSIDGLCEGIGKYSIKKILDSDLYEWATWNNVLDETPSTISKDAADNFQVKCQTIMDNEEDIVATLKSGENLKENLCSKISKFSRPPKVKTSAKKQGKEIL